MSLVEVGEAVVDAGGGMKLVVKRVGGMTRFLVFRESGPASNFLIGSGTSVNAASALRDAERLAIRARSLWATSKRVRPARATSGAAPLANAR